MNTKKDAEALRRARVRQLYEARPAEDRTENGVLLFFAWLQEHYPELLPQGKQGDPYQHLKVDLCGLYQVAGGTRIVETPIRRCTSQNVSSS
jgi:hypothetical protein